MNTKRGIYLGLLSYNNFLCPSFNAALLNTVKTLRDYGYFVDGGVIVGCAYIQAGRNILVDQFRQSQCDTFVFLDDDLSWQPDDFIKLIETPGRVVAGAYRKKQDEIEYAVNSQIGKHGIPLTRSDGCILAKGVATGFLKIERSVFDVIEKATPQLQYGKFHDFFPQGVDNNIWVGEDYAFCNLWLNTGGKIWIVPDINLTHYSKNQGYPGNYHEYLMRLPGGKLNRGKK